VTHAAIEYQDPFERQPDWPNVGKQVHVKLKDGKEFVGRLECDAFWGGDDEYPVWRVNLPVGWSVSLMDVEGWALYEEER